MIRSMGKFRELDFGLINEVLLIMLLSRGHQMMQMRDFKET